MADEHSTKAVVAALAANLGIAVTKLVGFAFTGSGAMLAAAVTGNTRYDAIGSIAIGLLLAVVAAVLAVEMRSLLLGESAAPDVERRISTAIEGGDHVERLIHLRTEHLGPEELLVVAKVE